MIKFKIKKGSKDIIRGIDLNQKFSNERWLSGAESQNHADLAKKLNKEEFEFCSVIILKDRLDGSLINNPKFCKSESFIGVSKIHEEVRRRMTNRYYSDDDINRIVSEWEYPSRQYNFKKDKLTPSFMSKLKDEIYQSQELALVPEIYNEYIESAKYAYDEKTDREIELSDTEYEKAVEILNRDLFLPQVYTKYERIYDLPKPFHFWDDRNHFQQYFMVSNGSEVDCIQSGPASSHQREMHGLWGHTFASLAKEKQIKTFILKYSSSNELHLIQEFNEFKAMDSDLTGNYQVNWEKTRHLFEGRLLRSEFEVESGTQKLVDSLRTRPEAAASLQ